MAESLPIALVFLCASVVLGWLRRDRFSWAPVILLFVVVAVSGAVIAARWVAVGYGPFLTLHEVLLSNVFSLALIIGVACLAVPDVARALPFSLSVVLVIGIWALTSSSEPARLPATFDSPWLWLHVGTGKLFLGMLLVSAGMAAAGLTGKGVQIAERTNHVVWRFASVAFVFDSAMLLTGAMWANHAWGRYWNWDPVETWALLTWLTLGLCLHARVTWKVPDRLGWMLVIGVFLLAFLTLFGMPFLSLGPHKGVI